MSAATIDTNGIITGFSQDYFTSDIAEGIMNALVEESGALSRAVGDFDSRRSEILRDSRYSASGKQEMLLDASQKAAAAAKSIEKRLGGLDNQAASIRAQMVEQRPTSGDKAVDELRAREVRDRFHAMPPEERTEAFIRASLAGDLPTIYAVQDAPLTFALLPEGFMAEWKERRLRMLHPVEHARLDDIARLVGVLDSNLVQFRAALGIRARAIDPHVV